MGMRRPLPLPFLHFRLAGVELACSYFASVGGGIALWPCYFVPGFFPRLFICLELVLPSTSVFLVSGV